MDAALKLSIGPCRAAALRRLRKYHLNSVSKSKSHLTQLQANIPDMWWDGARTCDAPLNADVTSSSTTSLVSIISYLIVSSESISRLRRVIRSLQIDRLDYVAIGVS